MKKINTITLLVAVVLSSCSNSQDVSIQKRWKAVDVEGNKSKKARYANMFAKHSTEMEFKNGKFNAYQDGVIQGSADYTMASDGKSLIVMDNGKKEMTLKIISLDGENMHAVMDGFMSDRDTIIFAVTGSKKEKEIEKETKNNQEVLAWEAVERKWSNVQTEYQRRTDLVNNLLNILKTESDFDKKALNDIIVAKAKVSSINLKAENITHEKIAEFKDAQVQLSRALKTTEVIPSLERSENYTNLRAQLEGVNNRINVARRDFNVAVIAFNKIVVANGKKSKDLELKADNSTEKVPDVKF